MAQPRGAAPRAWGQREGETPELIQCHPCPGLGQLPLPWAAPSPVLGHCLALEQSVLGSSSPSAQQWMQHLAFPMFRNTINKFEMTHHLQLITFLAKQTAAASHNSVCASFLHWLNQPGTKVPLKLASKNTAKITADLQLLTGQKAEKWKAQRLSKNAYFEMEPTDFSRGAPSFLEAFPDQGQF